MTRDHLVLIVVIVAIVIIAGLQLLKMNVESGASVSMDDGNGTTASPVITTTTTTSVSSSRKSLVSKDTTNNNNHNNSHKESSLSFLSGSPSYAYCRTGRWSSKDTVNCHFLIKPS